MSDSPTADERLAELADDFARRYRRGEHPSPEQYSRDHPALAAQIRELFPALIAMEQSGADAEVTGLAAERPGATVGRYKLLERLGEGGFGVVFLADQLTPVRRKVALKVIKPGLDTSQVIARFGAERQALAMMDHENIARVLDAGATDSGRPYFVMELVKGIPITDYCEQNQLPPRQRLGLFVRVCGAVQHAHTKGIIHRDLKPTNILVAVHDGLPVPKVIDFGVAKATGLQQLADGTLFTSVAQIVGTPLYMSPEQAEMSGVDVDTRSDVYSLGVLLYELLTGTTPVDKDRLKRAGFDEVRRIIRDEEPPRPSTRIGTLGGQLPAGSAGRRGDLKKLGQLVRGELDWIVMKALEKDRDRRYETVSGLAADVERYLNDEAVQACPPSASYRAAKLLRRHKGPVVAVGVVALALVGGIIGTTWGMARARAESGDKARALAAAQASEGRARDQQYLALVSQAHAERSSGRSGQRFEALRTVAKAAQIRVTPQLRWEAAAALALPDMEVAQEWVDTDPAGELTVSFDGETIHYARVSQDGGITIGRVTGGREEADTRLAALGHSVIRGPWWSADRRFLAYGHSGTEKGRGGALRVLKLNGPATAVILDESDGVNLSTFAFHAGGRKFAVGHATGDASVYDVDTGRWRKLGVGLVTALAFHPRDDRLALVCGDVVQIFDCNTWLELKPLRPAPSTVGIGCIAWHPDGRRVAVGCVNRIHVFDADSGTEILPPWENRANVETIAFDHSGERLLSWDFSMQTVLWDVTARERLLPTPNVLSPNATFSPDDRLVAFSRVRRGGGKVQVWQVASGNEVRLVDNPADRMDIPQGGVTDDSGRVVAFGTVGGERLCFFDTASGEKLATVSVPAYAARPFAFDPGARGWLTSGTRGVMLWPLRSEPGRPASLRVGPPQLILASASTEVAGSGPRDPVAAPARPPALDARRSEPASAEALPASQQLLSSSGARGSRWATSGASSDGRVFAMADMTSATLVDRELTHPPLKLGLQGRLRACEVSPDGKWVVTCTVGSDGSSKPVRIWGGKDGRPVADLPLSGSTWWASFSPDGQWLATYDESESQLWKVGSWSEPVRSWEGSVLFSPDGKRMAVNDVVGSVRLVEIESGDEVARFTGPERNKYWPQCFTPDGTRLIALGQGLCVWDFRLIRGQLSAMGLDWDPKHWPPFPKAVPDPRGRLRLIVDTGTSLRADSAITSPRPQGPTPETVRPR